MSFSTAPAESVESVEDGKIPNKKRESEANVYFFVRDFAIFNAWMGPVEKLNVSSFFRYRQNISF